MDTQAVKHAIQHSGRYNRKGFESPTKRAKALGDSYQSDLIRSIRENDFSFEEGRLKIKLAKSCLLYTSPSPRDATLSRMPSSA